jgi:hypothetical protein
LKIKFLSGSLYPRGEFFIFSKTKNEGIHAFEKLLAKVGLSPNFICLGHILPFCPTRQRLKNFISNGR